MSQLLNEINNNNFHNYCYEFNNFEYQIKDNKYIFEFFGLDTKELFYKNLQTQPSSWYYRNNPVTYTLNSYGYRTKEFDELDWENSIVMFGCSHVFGIGVTDEHTIPYILEKISGIPVINMGVCGSSIQTVLHNGIILTDSKYPTPKAILINWPHLLRHQIYSKEEIHHYGHWNIEKSPLQFQDHHVLFQNLMNIKMFRNLWKNKTIYLESTFRSDNQEVINNLDESYYCSFFDTIGNARDLAHSGSDQNFKVALEMYKQLVIELDRA